MKTIYITEEQKSKIKNHTLLTEARGDRALKRYIRENTNSIEYGIFNRHQELIATYKTEEEAYSNLPLGCQVFRLGGAISRYLDTPLSELANSRDPQCRNLVRMCNPGEGESEMFSSVKNNPDGSNTFADFLRINFYSDFGITRNGPTKEYMEGLARIALTELGYYSFDYRLKGDKVVKLARYMKIYAKNPDLVEKYGLSLDGNLNGLTYGQLMEYIRPVVEEYISKTKDTLRSRVYDTPAGYRIVEIKDIPSQSNGTPSVSPTRECYNYLSSLEPYADWCILGSRHAGMYQQYTCGGGKFYICEKDGFRSIPREPGENCPVDEYGLSLIAVLVATDGLPERITTRWNHDYGGEDHEQLENAIQLQDLLKVNYLDVFKPRTQEELHHLRLDESKKIPSAQEQVKNKANSALVQAAAGIEEGAEPESDEYKLGVEEGGAISPNYHVINEDSDEKEKEYKKYCKEIADFMYDNGLNVKPLPKLNFDWSSQDGLFIRTGYYEPEAKKVTIFCNDRHPKDILRSFAHEMIHHSQNLNGKNLSFSSNDDVKDNKELEKLESEAYLKGNIFFRKWTEYVNSKKKSLNESKILDEASPGDIDLSSFNIKKELNPKFWKNGLLDSRIRLKLMDIADDFIDFLGVDWVEPEDIIITGSLANYNWNKKYSDIDLHVLMDFSKVDKRKDFVKKYFDSQKNLWNDTHEKLNIFGFPVEVYVQDVNEKHTSTGVYSIDKNEWVTEPKREKLTKSKVNKNLIKTKVANYINKIDDLENKYKKSKGDEYKIRKISEKADNLFDEIKNERRNELNNKNGNGNEISNGNIVFKCLRRLNYIDKLCDLKTKTYDKMNSLP